MKRPLAVFLTAALTLPGTIDTAAPASAWAVEPFEEVVLPSARPRSHTMAYGALLAGAGLMGTSFIWRDRANDRYDEYLIASDPEDITRLYDETRTLDRLSSGALIAGQVLLATGVYLRFIRHPVTDRVSILTSPTRCAVSLRF
jgi:protein-S-isoprenylcysteine O-methyltransferase Ste14